MAMTMHLIWAWAVWMDISAVNATTFHALYKLFPNREMLIAILVVATVMAGASLLVKVRGEPLIAAVRWGVFLLAPQQIILMVCAAGAIGAMWLGQFADGVLRSQYFIISDQIGPVLIAVGHSVVIAIDVKRSIK
jgi:hypothetical protein